MHLMNVMFENPTDESFRALYSSFSKKEAISRNVWLVKQRSIHEKNAYQLDDHLGDFFASELKKNKVLPSLKELQFNLSVGALEFKRNAKFARPKKKSN